MGGNRRDPALEAPASSAFAPELAARTGSRRVSSPKLVLAVAVLGTFMAFVDATIVNIAVPDIAAEFSSSSLSSVSWVLNGYNIVFAAFLVGGGQLADLLGRRRVFCFALILFTFASALCAAAPSLGLLVDARLIQAAGAAMLVPSSLAIVLEAHDSRARTHAVAMWSAVAALAAGIGPPLGGLLITASDWRLVFLVNIPIGIVAFVFARRVLVESRAPGRRRIPDLVGGLVFALAIAALVLAVVKGQEWGWGSARVLGSFAAAAVLLGYFGFRSSRHSNPLIDPSLLRIRAFSISNAVTVVMAAGFYAYTLCNVLFLTGVWRYSILDAGLALTPGPVAAIAVAGPASRLVARWGHRLVIVPGALVWAAGMAFFATQLGTEPDFLGGWLPGMVILGIGAGLTFPSLSGAAVGSVPGTRFAIATSLNSVARQVGAALGVAILIAIIGTPSPLEALHAFQHGWLFAGACFVTGSLVCLGLSVGTAAAEEPLSAWQGSSETPLLDAVRPPEMPSLAEALGESAPRHEQTLADFLRLVPVFASLSAELREEIALIAREVSLARGEWLFHEGAEADAVYILRVGHLEVVQEGPEPASINRLTRGAVLGELALLSESTRSASIRALRDSVLVAIDRAGFETLLRSDPELALSLARALSSQLRASRPAPVKRRARPVTIALLAAGPGVALLDFADELSAAMCAWGRVAVLYPEDSDALSAVNGRGEGTLARYAPLVERLEQDHDQVLMLCGGEADTRAWDEFCIARADRVLAVVDASASAEPDAADPASTALVGLHGTDLVGLGVSPGSGHLATWVASLRPESVFAIAERSRRADIARMARRLTGRSRGVVLAGGGARAFAHLGVLEVLLDAGLLVDRVAGVSMGSFIAGLLACGHDSAAIDACCYEEWVRRNPINDYTIPRSALIRGRKAEAMLERTFGEATIEELTRPFYCASVDLRASRLVIDHRGPLALAVGASMSLPLIAPPLRRDERLLIDGSLLDNLPLAPMSASGEGPVLAIDIKGGEERPSAGPPGSEQELRPPRHHHSRTPSLPQMMGRVALLSSANTDEAARRFADHTITVRVPGVGLLEFHQIDRSREAGRRAAIAALESAADSGLLDAATPPAAADRRTVLRV